MLIELMCSASADAIPAIPHLRMLLALLVLIAFTSGISLLIYKMIERDGTKTAGEGRDSPVQLPDDDSR